ncbi:MAG: hypothetical protein KAQ68_07455 [Clostridiales bacterium]|nr:hypothetical protein [Clostridiales bacterium]
MKENNYVGVIIEESLEDIKILQKINLLETKTIQVTESHTTPWLEKWTLHTVEIKEDDVDEVSELLSRVLDSKHDWYADYKNIDFHYVIFRDKIFIVDRAESSQYEEVQKFGVLKGIPIYQLDFSYHINEWKENNTSSK